MNAGLLLLILMLGLSFIGVPIFTSIGIATLIALLKGGFPEIIVVQMLFSGMNSTALLAIPFFMLAGNVMATGGISQKLIDIFDSLVGWVKGSLGVVTVVSSAFFGAVSGSAVACCSAIGGIMMPSMKKNGYGTEFTAATVSASSILGMMIPPATTLIVFGASAEISISNLFKSALLPGIGMTVIFAIYVLIYAYKNDLPAKPRSSAKQIRDTLRIGIWALLMPVIVLGSIFGGIATATESAALAVVYTLIVSKFVYRQLDFKNFKNMTYNAGITTAAVLMLVGFSKASSWVITSSRLPVVLTSWISTFTSSPVQVLLLINILLLLVGMIMESCAAVVMLTPLLIPLANSVGVDTVHLGVIMSFNLCIGLLTPPVGNCLMLGYSMAGADFSGTLKKISPFIVLSIIWLMFITYIPKLCLI